MTYTPLTTEQLASLERRFWPKVDQSGGCWLWLATKTARGYGTMAIGETRSMQATWASLIVHGRPVPSSRTQVVMHTCDNPPCVNPDHLRLDSQSANILDMRAKGRDAKQLATILRGANHPASRLTWDQVCSIRERAAAGESQSSLAREVGVTPAAVRAIVRGRSWRVAA